MEGFKGRKVRKREERGFDGDWGFTALKYLQM